MRNATIGDIAREAAVGKATVSRVINNSGYVSEETRRKVVRVMERLNYHPSAAAQTLSRQASDTIGLILPEVSNQFFSEILKGVSEMVDERGYTLMLSSSENDPARDFRALRAMIGQRVRGLVYIPASDYTDEPLRGQLRRLLDQFSCPIVLLDRPLEAFSFDTVMSDNLKGGYIAARALVRAGHRRIGVVAGDPDLFIGRERLNGVRQALRESGMPLREEDIIPGKFDERITFERALERFRQGDCPTGFVLSNNLSAFGFLRAAEKAKLRIPEDVAFVSFDKLAGQELYGLPYTYLDRHETSQGRQAMQALFRRLESPDRPVERIVDPPDLVLKGSERRMP